MVGFRSSLAFALAGILCLGGTAHADITIDGFTSGSSGFPIVRTNPGSTTLTQNSLAGVIGGQRVTKIESPVVSAIDPITATVVTGTPGFFNYDSAGSSDGTASLTYNGGGTLNTDLTAGGNLLLRLTFLNYDFPGATPLPVSLTVSDGTLTKTVTQGYGQFSPPTGRLDFAFSDAGFAGLNFASVRSIEFAFDPIQGSDFRIGPIVASVPEPSSMVLSLVGLGLAVGVRGFRRRRAG